MYNVQHWVTRFFFRSEIIFRTTQELEYLFNFFVFLGVHILILSDFFIGMLHKIPFRTFTLNIYMFVHVADLIYKMYVLHVTYQ
jgi:hypothetical protein